MKKRSFDYQGAIDEGYSPEEITDYLSKEHPNFDVKGAFEEGYEPQEVIQHLYNPPQSGLKTAAKTVGQYGIGALESALLPYELAVAPVGSSGQYFGAQIEDVGSDIEDILERQYLGRERPGDKEKLEKLQAKISPENLPNLAKFSEEEAAKTKSFGTQGILERLSGEDLNPEGFWENSGRWLGWLTNPEKMFEKGFNLASVGKELIPSPSNTARAIGAGTGLKLAEQGQFGPIGTLAAGVAGDLMAGGVSAASKKAVNFVKNPKKAIGEAVVSFTKPEKLELQKQIIQDFRDAGIQADLGTLTDSNLTKWMQARIAQSGLTGKALDRFKQQLHQQIRNEYGELANVLGDAKFASANEAGTVVKEGINAIREADLAATRELYQNASNAIKRDSHVNAGRILEVVNNIEKELSPGRIKSSDQRAVLDILDKIKTDITDSSGVMRYGHVKDLMNNKIALNDIINYEVQGGTKQLLKSVVSELDRAIISHGKDNPSFARNYVQANKRFSNHAKTFRNKNISQLLKAADPEAIVNKMNSVQGIKDLEKVLGKSTEGKRLFDKLKRYKMDSLVADTLGESAGKQAQLGTFSNILKKQKNRDILKQMLGPKEYVRLQRLQKNAGRLADASNKFYNSSQSGTIAADAAVLAKGMGDVASVLMGNPWPLMKTAGSVLGVRQVANLLADPEFLKIVEEIILASGKSGPELQQAFLRASPFLMPLVHSSQESSDTPD